MLADVSGYERVMVTLATCFRIQKAEFRIVYLYKIYENVR